MAEFENRTPYAAVATPAWSVAGERVLAVVVKAALRFDRKGVVGLSPSPVEIELTDRHRGHPERTSLAAANECVPQKQGGEVILNATAQPGGHDLHTMEVEFALRSPHQGVERGAHLSVSGARRYERGLLGLTASEPEPLTPLPLIAEYAYGGTHPDNPGEAYAPNPVGLGYWRRAKHAEGQPLPQIHWHNEWITALSQRPVPALVGALATHWAPRAGERGTHNEAAAQGIGCPIGADATAAYYNCAPLHQRFPAPFRGGEIVTLNNLVEGQPFNVPLTFTLPVLSPRATLILGQERSELALACDTLVIDADCREIHLLFRAMVPWRMTERRKAYIVLRDAALTGDDLLRSHG